MLKSVDQKINAMENKVIIQQLLSAKKNDKPYTVHEIQKEQLFYLKNCHQILVIIIN